MMHRDEVFHIHLRAHLDSAENNDKNNINNKLLFISRKQTTLILQ